MQGSTTVMTAHRFALALLLLLACGAATEVSQQQQQQIASQDPAAESPYLLVTSYLNIYRMPINGADSRAELNILVAESHISAVAFHYRLGYIFWINLRDRCIKRANMDGTNITTLVVGHISNPADLAVDWIHDKLYWSDSGDNRIEEVDLHTNERRVVIQLNSTSSPLGLAVYPTVEHGILYWTDSGHRNLQRILTTGTSHAIIHQALQHHCVKPIALNLQQRMVYWGDQCAYSIESVLINGTSHSYVVNGDMNSVRFPGGMSQFRDSVYWVQPNGVFKKTGEEMDNIYDSPSSRVLQDIQVVHPDTQPTIEQLQQPGSSSNVDAECGDGCQNGGRCIFPGICDCPTGWAGLTCSEDENECQLNNGGCSHNCINTDGGYYCSCPQGFTQNGSNCIESSTTILPTLIQETQLPSTHPPPSHPPTLPSPTLEPKITSSGSQPTTSSTPVTDDISPTRTSTSTDLPYKPSATDTTDAVATSSDGALPTPLARPTTTTSTKVHPATIPIGTETENTHGDSVLSTPPPSPAESVEIDIRQTPLPTSDSKSGMRGRTDPTISGIDKADDAEESNPLVFIIPVSVVAGFVLLSLAVFAFLMVYVHCKGHRQGSYSFASPAILDIAGEVSTNTIKRGQVTRTSFKPIGSSSPSNAPETVAILSQPRDSSTRASSTISGSESFEWNHQ